MKKIFIAGCSYTNWNDGDCLGESYPALIAKEYPDWHVFDASECGGSNDSVYLKLRYLEKLYGAPDKVIVQWTHLGRTNINIFDHPTPRENTASTLNNYTYFAENGNDTDKDGSMVVNPSLLSLRSKWNRRQYNQLRKITGLGREIPTMFYSWFLNSRTLRWNTQKEIDLVNAVYGKDNVLMYDWQGHNSPGTNLTMPDNWIGSLAYAFRKKNKFMSLGIDDAPHYAAEGHLEVYKWLQPHLNKLLT